MVAGKCRLEKEAGRLWRIKDSQGIRYVQRPIWYQLHANITDEARNEDNKPFLKKVPSHPHGANFYPEDMSKDDFEKWLSTSSKQEKEQAEGYYTVIRRKDGQLTSIPFSTEYKSLLSIASTEFKAAATLVSDPTLKDFLLQRAEAFQSNDYIASDIAWYNVSAQSPLEVTAGPYEVYDDELYGYKAAYEILIHVRDFSATNQLQKFTSSLHWIETRLPIPEKYRNTELKAPVIVVVNQIWAGGMRILSFILRVDL
jgi:Peptidase family M49